MKFAALRNNAMQVDHSDDYLAWDNTEILTVTLRRGAGAVTITDVVGLPGMTSAADLDLNGLGADSKSVTWAVPDILVNPTGTDPRRELKKDDVLTSESGKVYRVVSADYRTHARQWDAVTVPDRTA